MIRVVPRRSAAMEQRERTAGGVAIGAERAGVPVPRMSERMAALPEELRRGTGDVLKVSTRSRPSAVAGAIAGILRQCDHVEVQAIGAGATNQAIKAVAIARGYVAPGGLELYVVPCFADISVDGEERTAIRLMVEGRALREERILPLALDATQSALPTDGGVPSDTRRSHI